MFRYWIWLSTRKYLSGRDKRSLLEHFGTPEAVYLADEFEFRQLVCFSDRKLASLLDKDLRDADKILTDCDNRRVSILTYQDAAYPARLKNISDPPLLLYYEGRLPALDDEVCIGVVGTRKASAYGLKHAKELSYQLGRGGAVIVSGAAVGIDCAAMEGALSSGKPVIAVLGNGTDVVYPASSRNLLTDVRRNGCILSEYPPGTPPCGDHFPVRNRIISGLAQGVLVVEAPRGSGALITANRALEQGRDVFTIPGNLGVETLEGNLQLLRDGAVLVECGADILREYAHRYHTVTDRKIDGKFSVPEPAEIKDEPRVSVAVERKTIVDNEKIPNYIDLEDILPKVSKEGAAVLQTLAAGPLHVDDIIVQTKIPASGILSAVTILEIRGYIKRLPGRYFSLAEKK